MFPINQKKCLNRFKSVRCLSGRDLFSRLGERIPTDRGFLGSRNPATRQDEAMYMIYDDYSKLQPTETVPADIPPAIDPAESAEA